MIKLLLVLIVVAVLAVLARWFLPIGPAQALSGGLLEVGRQRITLHGIEAAPSGQLCGGSPCDALARQALADLVQDRYVFCLPYDRDLAGVYRGICWAGAIELNEAMVRSGLAVATPTGASYAQAESAARERGRGMWDPASVPAAEPGRVPLVQSPN